MVSFPLPLNASKQDLLSTAAAKLRITEQKNLFKGACANHVALKGGGIACPLKALARQVAPIQVHTSDGTTILCAYWDSVGRGDVTDRDMICHIKFAAQKLSYPSRNIPLDRIDTHSNQAGRSCAMKMAVFDDETIRKIRKWLSSSNTFLEYIQQQLSGFSQCMATKMSRIVIFTNMEGSEKYTG